MMIRVLLYIDLRTPSDTELDAAADLINDPTSAVYTGIVTSRADSSYK
jgi:hypothetical protein